MIFPGLFGPQGRVLLRTSPPAPTVTSISPAMGDPNFSNPVTITGTNFATPATVKIDGVTVASYTVVSSTTITAFTTIVPRGLGAKSVSVQTAGGTDTLATAYTYLPSLAGKTLYGMWESENYTYSTGVLTGTTTAGPSAGRSLVPQSGQFAQRPLVGATLNGYPTLDIDTFLKRLVSDPWLGTDFFTTTDATIAVLVQPVSCFSTPPPNANNTRFFGVGRTFQLCGATTGSDLYAIGAETDSGGNPHFVNEVMHFGAWHCLQISYYGGLMRFRVDNHPWQRTSVPAMGTGFSDLGQILSMFDNSYGSIVGLMAGIITSYGLVEADCDDILNYYRAKYNLTLSNTPTVTAVSPSVGNPNNSNAITITGTNFNYIGPSYTTVTIGGTSVASFTIVNATTITAMTSISLGGSGLQNVVVSTPAGTGTLSNGYNYVVPFNPAALPLSLWLKDYNTQATWTGTVSAGNSGLRTMTVAGSPTTYGPSVGALPNGASVADFDGYQNVLENLANFYVFTDTAGSLAALVQIREVTFGSTNAWSSPLMLGDASGAAAGIAVGRPSNDTVQFFDDDFGSPTRRVELPAPIGAWAFFQMRWGSNVLEARINNGPWTTTTWRNSSLYGVFSLGKSAGSHYLNMRGRQFFGSLVRMADADFDGLLGYLRTESGLNLLNSTTTVVSVSPDIGANAAGQPITIKGANYVSGATVSLGGVACTSVVVVNSTTITAVTPLTTAGRLTAVVVSNGDTGILNDAFYSLEVNGASFWTLHHGGNPANTTSLGVTHTAADQGPGAYDAIDSTGAPPNFTLRSKVFNSRSTLNFPQIFSCLKTATFNADQPATRFIVGRTSGAASPQYLADGLSDYMGLSGNGTTNVEMYAAGGLTLATDPSLKTVYTQVFDNAGGNTVISANSNTETPGSVGINNPGGLTIGAYHGNYYSCQGELGLVFQVFTPMTLAQRTLNRELLGSYYAIPITP